VATTFAENHAAEIRSGHYRAHAQRERSERRRALRLLAGEPEGVIEAMMLAHGFRVELLVDLCIAGLATAKPEQMHAGGRTMESEDRVASEAVISLRFLLHPNSRTALIRETALARSLSTWPALRSSR